ncbi:response regulator transcription factor [Tannockella kyphosi]|uniref:response regulator transcription factor n=1 Tax=Tannockella kyphosi TaxID=2899121 RepID=UPI00201120B6|nr:response regulator transcription factor [Tannockella kyphosi]
MIGNKQCILIVDDEVRMLVVLKDFFVAQNYEVLLAENGQVALDIHYQNNTMIDLILLDVMMPVKDGFETLIELRENKFDTPVIMLTAKSEEYDQIKGFQYGVDDYITKPFSLSLLIARVESVLRRTMKQTEQTHNLGLLTLVPSKRTVLLENKPIELTRREYDLLQYFILNKEITLTREQILLQVWGYDYQGDNRTVDTHIKQLRMKLKGCSHYIKTVHGVGYLFEVQV